MNRHRAGTGLPREAVFALAAVLFVLVAGTAILIVAGGGGSAATPTQTPARAVLPDPAGEPTAPVSSDVAANPPGSTAREVASDCPGWCFVRITDAPAAESALATIGVSPTLVEGGAVWAHLSGKSLQQLRQSVPATVIQAGMDTVDLYVVRVREETPSDADVARIQSFGTVLDQAGNRFIVSVPDVPPDIRPLADWGIAVEKVPPPVAPRARTVSTLAPVPGGGAVAAEVSDAEIRLTIQQLSSMGAAEGASGGSRYYLLNGNLKAAEYLYRRMAAYGANVWYEDFVAGDGTLALNVVAELPGRDDSARYLFLAHYDSIADDTDGDMSVAPGALDNGTGVATLLEVARVLSQYDLAHPVRFLFTDIEEVGLQGAEAYGRRALTEGVTFDAAFNVDSVGAADGVRQLYINADGPSEWIQTLLAQTHDQFGFNLNLNLTHNPDFVADDTPLSDYGIPTVMIGSVLYGDPLINRRDDTLAAVDIPYVGGVASLLLATIVSLVAAS